MPYVFNKITVRPQLPKRIDKLGEIAYNLWWSWNTDFLRLFKNIDVDLWEKCQKNPVKFLRLVSQEKLEAVIEDVEFLSAYDTVVEEFNNYMNSKNTWYSKNHADHKDDSIAYFSAEYGLDQTVGIYAGGLGILSGDHLKAASDLGIPLTGIGLLYKHGYFTQKINGFGEQQTVYKDLDFDFLPIHEVKDEEGKPLMVSVNLPEREVFLKVYRIDVGRIKLYLMDSDIDENADSPYRDITTKLYGGDQEYRVQQEIVLGIAGVRLVKKLGLDPSVYHMNEGHSSFLLFELISNLMQEKEVSFAMARTMVYSKTVFTTHTPVPAGNDIFPVELIEKYFDGYWDKFGIPKERFLRLGMKVNDSMANGFNMGILALKMAGKKNGVSKLHGAVSRELFTDIWPDVPPQESPIGYVTNGVHTCTWLAPTMKKLYNQYLRPYWQDNIPDDETWKGIYNIPDNELWAKHQECKQKLLDMIKKSTTERLRRYDYSYEDIDSIVGTLDPNVLTIGFARRFATYKRATLIFRDLERITKIFNDAGMPIQLVFAGKAHPYDKEGAGLIKYIHELSLKPQFRGKLFLLENYNIGTSRYLVSGVDVWLNNPRRPLEASGTSGQKAAVNGAINFSVLDGWWAEGYNQKNGWTIGSDEEFTSYEVQDNADSKSMYDTLENKIMPMYYRKNEEGYSPEWMQVMKNSIAPNSGVYSTARMLQDYTNQLYVPLMDLKPTYSVLENIVNYNEWRFNLHEHFGEIEIKQSEQNFNNMTVDAGNQMEVGCEIKIPVTIDVNSVTPQVFYGKISEKGIVDDIKIVNMNLVGQEENVYKYTAKIDLKTGGDYGYTFRVVPHNDMILDPMTLNEIKWITEEAE